MFGIRARSCVMSLLFTAAVMSVPFTAYAQRLEHYNSPLYSAKTYDPTVSETSGLPPALKEVGIEQKLGAQLPLDVEVKNEDGQLVKLDTFFHHDKPVIIAFVYYECPMLCSQVLNGLLGSLKGMSLTAGRDFDVVAISFDAREFDNPVLAKQKKANYVERYGRPDTENGWHFLTASEDSIQKVTSAAGFSFKWDEKSNQFAHAAGIMVTSPQGVLSHYFYGIEYSPKDIKFALMDSSAGRVGSPVEKLLLYCYHYDPSTGKYGLAILRVMRLGGIATLLGMGFMAIVFWRRNKKKRSLVNV